MIDLDEIAIASVRRGDRHLAGGGRENGAAVGLPQINSRMQRQTPEKRIDARAEGRCHLQRSRERLAQRQIGKETLETVGAEEIVLQFEDGAVERRFSRIGLQRNIGAADPAFGFGIGRRLQTVGFEPRLGERAAQFGGGFLGDAAERGDIAHLRAFDLVEGIRDRAEPHLDRGDLGRRRRPRPSAAAAARSSRNCRSAIRSLAAAVWLRKPAAPAAQRAGRAAQSARRPRPSPAGRVAARREWRAADRGRCPKAPATPCAASHRPPVSFRRRVVSPAVVLARPARSARAAIVAARCSICACRDVRSRISSS